MKLFGSLRSRLILASVLWTSGLLMLMHMASMVMLHFMPGMRNLHAPAMAAVGVALMIGGLAAPARASLSPFRLLREKLSAVERGETQSVEGEYLREVQPVIDDLNALLAARAKAVARASTAAADLAHGLKTPLAVLAQEAASSASMQREVERMSRQVDYHLARARAAASGSSGAPPCPVAPCADALFRTLAKLHASRGLNLTAQVPAAVTVRVQPEDLDEMLGNLLDNACKWARSRVVLKAEPGEITVEDDGPGLDPALRLAVLERGVRADQAAPGSGLGLAIVRDLAELYGGSITLESSSLGGVSARLSLPVA